MRANAVSKLLNEKGDTVTVTTPIVIENANISFNIQYMDMADEKNPKRGTFAENINLQLNNDDELDRQATDKPYLKIIIPQLVAQLVKRFDPNKTAAKELKEAIAAALIAE